MIQTKTTTRTTIRAMLLSFQLRAVVEQTVKCEKLKQIIDERVRTKDLDSFAVWGMKDEEAHACMQIQIDYARDTSKIRFSGNVPSGDCPSQVTEQVDLEVDEPIKTCRIWQEAIEWFVRLCEAHDLPLRWTVRWTAKANRSRLRKRYGLVSANFTNKTEGGVAKAIPNSFFSELTAMFAFSGEMAPSEGT